MTLPVLAPELDAPFRCTHFACTLAMKHCLRRQMARREGVAKNGNGRAIPWSKVLHEYCGSGECEQGNEIRARFPAWVPAKQARRQAPRLDLVAKVHMEADMPTGLRSSGPCKGCGAKGNRCRAGCTEGAAAKPAPKAPARLPAREAPEAHTTEELLARKAELLAEVRAIDSLLRARVDEEEAKLRRLREAVREAESREASTVSG